LHNNGSIPTKLNPPNAVYCRQHRHSLQATEEFRSNRTGRADGRTNWRIENISALSVYFIGFVNVSNERLMWEIKNFERLNLIGVDERRFMILQSYCHLLDFNILNIRRPEQFTKFLLMKPPQLLASSSTQKWFTNHVFSTRRFTNVPRTYKQII